MSTHSITYFLRIPNAVNQGAGTMIYEPVILVLPTDFIGVSANSQVQFGNLVWYCGCDDL